MFHSPVIVFGKAMSLVSALQNCFCLWIFSPPLIGRGWLGLYLSISCLPDGGADFPDFEMNTVMGSMVQTPPSYDGGAYHLLWEPGIGNEASPGNGGWVRLWGPW